MRTKKKKDVSKSRNEPGNRCLLIWNVPGRILRLFKMTCVEREVTMRETIIRLIKEYLKR